MSRKWSILGSPGFILGLALLLLNDHWWKYEFHNIVTGKLSDFAGLFIFPMFFAVILPRIKKHIYWITTIGFIFWKSPASEFLIEGWNSIGIFSVVRVIDYTDLLALMMLPPSYLYYERIKKTTLQFNPIPVILISSFAFIATSQGSEKIDYKKRYEFDYSLDTLREKIFYLESLEHTFAYPIQKIQELDSITNDSVIIHPPGYWVEKKHIIEDAIKDSASIYIRDTFCNSTSIEARIIVGSVSPDRSFMQVEYLSHRCFKKDKEQKEQTKRHVIQIFEERVIKPLIK